MQIFQKLLKKIDVQEYDNYHKVVIHVQFCYVPFPIHMCLSAPLTGRRMTVVP